MNPVPQWWKRPRTVRVVVDNPSWILPYAEDLVTRMKRKGDHGVLCRNHDEIPEGSVAFYLGCMYLTPPEVLNRNRRNLVVHESDLPMGKGFSPLTWQIIEGRDLIPVTMFEATGKVDAGPVVYRECLRFEGHELIDEMREALGKLTVSLCMRFLDERIPPAGVEQRGKETFYPRRFPRDSELDVMKSIGDQFNLLRTIDNKRYPAFFYYKGHRYILRIEKDRGNGPKGKKIIAGPP